MHWFPFYSSDFLGATVGLSCLERALYALMLPLYYEVGPFPAEQVRVYRIVGCESDEQKRAVDYLLERYFVLREDGWYQSRAEEVKVQQAQKATESHDLAVTRGKKSAAVRLEKYGTAQPIKPETAFESVSKGLRKASGKRSEQNQNQNQNHSQTQNQKPEAPSTLPSWLPVQSWKDWLDHRGASHGKFTRRAQELAIKTLDQLRLQGNDPVDVIERSIASGWKGLFALDHNKGKPKGQPGIEEWLRTTKERDREPER